MGKRDEAGADEARFGSILDHLTEGFQVLDREWRFVYLNEAAAAHARRNKDELVGKSFLDAYPGIEDTAMFARLERCMRERTAMRMENLFVYPDGSSASFELRAQPIPEGILLLSLDVSERKRVEAQLVHAQKMKALGRLAGGVAHDFNNLLTIISGCATMVRHELGPTHSACEDLDDVLGAADQAAQLVRKLLTFSRQQPVEPRVLDPNDLIRDVDEMMRQLIGEDVEYAVDLEPVVWPVRIDAGVFEQVLMNLAVNAREAMPHGGRMLVATRNVTIDVSHELTRCGLPAGDYVLTSVIDSGIGMDEVTRSQVFEPFFTTKGPEQGAGLGLSICHGIVKQAGGHICVDSDPGHGAAFDIYLPRVRAKHEMPSREPRAKRLTGDETVLLTEDDDQLRRLAARTLVGYGYTVVEAAGPHEALRLCRDPARHIDLLITDVTMPVMNGAELAAEVAALRPELRVLFLSGYAAGALHAGTVKSGAPLLSKPFTPEALARKVRETLDA